MSESENPTLLKGVFKSLKRFWLLVIGVVLVITLVIAWPLISNSPVRYADINDHFKYGSIGSEPLNGVPYWIWKVLPAIFPDKLPGEGYASLGFIYEPGQDRPIGFSKRRIFVDRVGLNCAVCHAGTVRDTPDSTPRVITTMPSNTVDLGGYIKLISEVAFDPRFNADRILAEIAAQGEKFNPIQKLMYRYLVIPQTRDALMAQGSLLAFLNNQPDRGPGRVDTFNPYKSLQFRFPMDQLDPDELIGGADFPSIWNQK
ncbi:MAG: cytochrome c, partial [Moorea sp. SIO3C2]|nr:cytochrome c [Moorena sp. SIO3C2]